MVNTRVYISYAFVDDTHADYLFAQRLASDLRQAGAEVVIDTADVGDQTYVQQMNRVLLGCQWFIVIQTPGALRSLHVQLSVNMALQLVTHQQLQGVLAVLATPCDTQDIPSTWNELQIIDAREDYPKALAKVFLALGLDTFVNQPQIQSSLPFPLEIYSTGNQLETYSTGNQSVELDRPAGPPPLSMMEKRVASREIEHPDRPWSGPPSIQRNLRKPARERKRLAIILGSVLLSVLLLSGIVYAFTVESKGAVKPPVQQITPPGSISTGTTEGATSTSTSIGANSDAIVTINPVRQTFQNTYTIFGVTGSPDAAQKQIQATVLSATQVQSQNVIATGHKTIAAVAAKGTITIFNDNTTAQVVPAGTIVSNANNTIQVVLDADATPGPGNPSPLQWGASTVPAHAVIPGVGGNIAKLTIDNACCNAININLYATNEVDFAGGQDAQDYTYLQQSDIDNAANPLISSLTQNAQAQVQAQISAQDTTVSSTQCTHIVTSSAPANSHVVSVTVSVTVTCSLEVYNPQNARAMAITTFRSNHAAYTFLGTPITQITQVNTKQQTVSLTINVTGNGVFQFSMIQEQQFARLIAGKSPQDAQNILMKQTGVSLVSIVLKKNKVTLPIDPNKIAISISNW